MKGRIMNMKTLGRNVATMCYWLALAGCVALFVADDGAYAGSGVKILGKRPCIVTDAECPVCGSVADSFTAYYNMAGQLLFTLEDENGEGSYEMKDYQWVICYKKAICKDRNRNEELHCNPETGCGPRIWATGCKEFYHEGLQDIYHIYPLWKEAPED